jgi:hypothetical protein
LAASDRYYTIRPATAVDAIKLAPRVKPADLRECAGMTADPIERILLSAVELGKESYSAVHDGRVDIMFGVAEGDSPRLGILWLLGAEAPPAGALALLRLSRHYVDRMGRGFSMLMNYTDASHIESHKLIRWCGFTIEPPAPIGLSGEMFCRFWRKM